MSEPNLLFLYTVSTDCVANQSLNRERAKVEESCQYFRTVHKCVGRYQNLKRLSSCVSSEPFLAHPLLLCKTKQKKPMIFLSFIFYKEAKCRNELDCATFGYLLLKPLGLGSVHRLFNGLHVPPGGSTA